MLDRTVRVACAVVLLGALAVVAPAAAAAGWTPEPARYGHTSTLNQPITAPDGTVLRADVYAPADPSTGKAAAGRFPVILIQTPYGKGSYQFAGAGATLLGDPSYLVERGYIVAIADVRGTGASGGQWGLFGPQQASDGATLVRWAAALPGSNGRVGLLGASYLGIDQFFTAAAAGRGSPVKAIFPIIAANDVYRDAAFDGGLLNGEFGLPYLLLVSGINELNPLTLLETPNPATVEQLTSVIVQHLQAVSSLDLPTIVNIGSDGDQAYDGAYWQTRAPRNVLAQIVADRIPVFMVGGWYDLFQRGEPLNYAELQNLWAGRPMASPMSRHQRPSARYQLLMGPWYHVTTGQGVDLNAIELRWFDRWLKLEHTGIAQIKTPLHVYELGAGHYLDTTRYPFTGATPTTYFLGPAGTLARTRPDRAGGADTLVWTGLSSFCSGSTEQWGAGFGELIATSLGSHDPCASDDRAIQTGPGAATYTTAPFTEPTLLAGPIDATLYASSTTRDAEWVVTVEDVSPSGASKPLSSGALLGSLRATDRALTWTGSDGRPLLPFHPYTKESVAPLTPGQLTRFDVEVFPTFASLAPGHRLRVTVSTADTPHLTPLPAQIANLIGGVYRLSHSADAASFVELPLAPASAFTTACGLCG